MSSSDQNTITETRDEAAGLWWQVLPFAIFGVAALLLLVASIIQAFWPDVMAGHSLNSGLILLSICATALIGGLAVMTRYHLTTGLGMVLIALIPLVWVVFGQTGAGPAGATSGAIVSAQCDGAPWATGRRNFAANGLDEPAEFNVSVPAGVVGYYRFRVTETTAVRLEVANGDPALSLTDEAGLQLQANDDTGGTRNAQIEAELAEGTYCIGVRNVGEPTPYKVRIGLQTHAALIETPFHACQASDLRVLQVGDATDFRIREDEYKALRVTIRDGIVLEGESSTADPKLMIYTFDGQEVAYDDDGGAQTNALLTLSPGDIDDGEYCLVVDSVSGRGAISVHASTFDREVLIAREIARGERTPDIDSDLVGRLGLISGPLTQDVQVAGESEGEGVGWYQFEVAQNGLIVIELNEGRMGDPKLTLYTYSGREIAQDDDSGGGHDAQISMPLSAGKYLISVGSLNLAPFDGQLNIQIYDAQ